MTGLHEYVLTFGSQYGTREPHPLSNKIHADGYMIVEAMDYVQAREYVVKIFGEKWSHLYSEAEWARDDKTMPNERLFPLGEIGRIDSNGHLTIWSESI